MRVFALMILIASSLFSQHADATEYNLRAYFLKPEKVAAAIGSNDAALRSKLLGMTAFVEDTGLERKFNDPSIWKTAVNELVSGEPRSNSFMNPFSIWMLLDAIAEKPEQPFVGLPFVDLSSAKMLMKGFDNTELSVFLGRIDYGNTTPPFTGLPMVLRDKLGASEYPARISVFTPTDAAALLRLMPQVREVNTAMDALQFGDDAALESRAQAGIRKAASLYWGKHFANADNLQEGETAEQATMRMVEQELADPYQWTDASSGLAEATDIISGWLRHSFDQNKAIFFIYETF